MEDKGLRYNVCVLDKDHNTVVRATVATLEIAHNIVILTTVFDNHNVGYASIQQTGKGGYNWHKVY